MTFTVRVIGKDEIPSLIDEIMRIETESFSVPWAAGDFFAPLPGMTVAAAFGDGGTVIGYGCLMMIGGEAELLNLAVDGSVRRQGVGRAILDFLIGVAREGGAEICLLEVRESNTAAAALYAARGFYRVGSRRAYYRKPTEDAVVMKLDVLPDDTVEAKNC